MPPIEASVADARPPVTNPRRESRAWTTASKVSFPDSLLIMSSCVIGIHHLGDIDLNLARLRCDNGGMTFRQTNTARALERSVREIVRRDRATRGSAD